MENVIKVISQAATHYQDAAKQLHLTGEAKEEYLKAKASCDRAIAILTAAQPLGDAAVKVLEAAKALTRGQGERWLAALRFDPGLLSADEQAEYIRNGTASKMRELFRALVESLPEDRAYRPRRKA